MKKILKCFNFFWPKSSGNFFKLLIHASLFSALQFWKCSARKIFAVEKAEVSANLQNEAIG